MRLSAPALLLAAASTLSAANPFQPVISPNGVVNAASNLSHAFSSYGIARGSMFVVYGSALGPVDLVQAPSFPLSTAEGLAGTRVLISIGGYAAACPMVYTSLTQVAAIMPSNAPEGEGTLVVSYQNFASSSVPVRVVRSAFGLFTRNQAGSGPAIAQNFISQASTPLNSLISSATPGQTVILWGTGLGPAAGDETAGPLPGALSSLDSLYVGGLPANVRYAGRSGCCAAIDQIVFDVPAGVSGCYVPIAAVTGGVVSNFGTISVAATGKECDDPLSFRASALAAASRNGAVRTGQISLTGMSSSEIDISAGFFSVDLNTFLASTAALNPPPGSCYLSVRRVGDSPARGGTGLNAGSAITITGPSGLLSADNTSSGGYSMTKSPATLVQGTYSISSTGGSDVGPISAQMTLAAPPLWTNLSAFTASAISPNQLVFNWTGADPAGLVTIRVSSANATYDSAVLCNVSPAAGTFTIPAFLVRALYPSPVTISLTAAGAAVSFPATGLDTAIATAATTVEVKTTLLSIVP